MLYPLSARTAFRLRGCFMKRSLISLLLLMPALSAAGPLEYVCTVKQELSIIDDGYLKPHGNPIEVGNLFKIDRKTGKIIGPPFGNSTARDVQIITQGDSSRNFEVLSASSPTGKATSDLVIVHEWKKGIEKTFVGLASGFVYSGTCK